MAKKTIVGTVTDSLIDLKDTVMGALSPPAKSAKKAVVKIGRSAMNTVSAKKNIAKKAVSKTRTAAKKAVKKVASRKKHF